MLDIDLRAKKIYLLTCIINRILSSLFITLIKNCNVACLKMFVIRKGEL